MHTKIEANEYKDYIFGFIFYKFLSEQEVKFILDEGLTKEEFADEINEEHPENVGLHQNRIGYFGVGGNGNLNGFNLNGDGSSWNPFRNGELPAPGFRALDRFDWGLQFQLTAQVCRGDLTLSYELGLYENSIGSVLSDDWRTRTFSITLGYTFGK